MRVAHVSSFCEEEVEYVCKGFNFSVGDDMPSSLACVDDDEEVSSALQSNEIQLGIIFIVRLKILYGCHKYRFSVGYDKSLVVSNCVAINRNEE